jgi:lysophospholipase L1-like esterase
MIRFAISNQWWRRRTSASTPTSGVGRARDFLTRRPYSNRDQTSGLDAIAAATDAQRVHITFINVGRDFEWPQFFQGCHPSPGGYRMIAANVARAVAPLLATTAARPSQGQRNGLGGHPHSPVRAK